MKVDLKVYTDHVLNSIADAIMHKSKLSQEVATLSGMSSPKVRHMLNNIVSFPGINYLEIGCFNGSTAVPALYKNDVSNYTIIDNWKFRHWEGEDARDMLFERFDNILGYEPNIIEEDCFAINPEEFGIKDIDVYFYDGEHYEEDQYNALSHYYESLSDTFIYIVDDANHPPALTGTFKAIREKELKIECHRSLFAIGNGDGNNFWNGVYVAVLSK